MQRLLALLLIAALPGATALAQQVPPMGYRSGVLGARDHRVPIVPDRWPWSSIGRVNVVMGLKPSFCTGTLIGARHVITAAHCLFDRKTNGFVKPQAIDFVPAHEPDKFAAHAAATALVISPDFRFRVEDRPRSDTIAPDMIKNDWAIVTLDESLPSDPVPIRAVPPADLPDEKFPGEIALAGYGQDHPFILSVHKGCTAQIDDPVPGVLLHTCDSMPGGSGSPLLLLDGDKAWLVGLHTASSRFTRAGHRPRASRGVPASMFEQAARTLPGN